MFLNQLPSRIMSFQERYVKLGSQITPFSRVEANRHLYTLGTVQ
jgi:hypothetical protein